MSRIDRHVTTVQSKLMLAEFMVGLGWAFLVLGAVFWINVLVDKLLSVHIPKPQLMAWIGVGLAVAFGIVFAILRKPDRSLAAVEIDKRLGLKEKYSTALYARNLNDPFAAAAVRDAEAASAGVDLRGKFKLSFPRIAYYAMGAFAVVLATMQLPRQDLLASTQQVAARTTTTERDVKQAKELVKRAIATVEAAPKAVAGDEKVELAKKDLERALSKADKDPIAAKRTAMKAQQDLEQAVKEQIKNNQRFAEAENNEKMMKSIGSPPIDEKGPVADAHRDIAKGDFNQAVNDISKAVENFDKMDKKDQEKAAEQMKNLANQLQQMAKDPKTQQKVQQQLQQMGANQQQQQQIAQAMQKAANGDKQAQQQLQQMQKQLQQQMNNGQGPTQQQQQQISQMMQQMQAQVNTQQGAQAMAQAAQQMAQAMQQQAGGQPKGQQQNPNQQNAQNQGQQGQQQGGQQQGGQQQMAQGQQQMQQQLQQMQAAQQDMQQMQAAQNAAQQGAQQAQNAMNGQQGGNQGGNQQGQNGQDGQGQGQANQGGQNQNLQQGGNQNGMNGGAAQAMGQRPGNQAAPFTVKQEVSPSQDNEKGKILASRWVKAGTFKGESKAQLTEIATAAEQAETDEVEQERITGQAREAQKKYFNSLQEETK